jgi:tetratricopeptide (TPR) repeat protein
MKKTVILILFVILSINAFACSMFTKTIDGKTLVGNNEDWKNPDPVVWIQPGEGEKFDCMYVGFDDFFPQGGMNEKGLCLDGFATESKPVLNSLEKPFFDGILTKHVMETCSTIDEVIAVFDSYNQQSLEMAMLMFVDKTGDAVIIEGDKYIRKDGNFQIVTNFYQSEVEEGEKTGCVRYDNLLSQLPELDVTIDDFAQALATTHQEGQYPTQYTNIFNPNKLEMYLYRYHDYSNYLTFNLKEEIKKDRQVIPMKDVFPKLYAYERFAKDQARTLANKLHNLIDEKGLKVALEECPELLEKKKIVYSYPLDEFEMNDMGYSYLTNGKTEEAIALFKINVEHFPESWNVYDSLGEAYMEAGETDLAIKNYAKSVELNPESEGGIERLKELKKKIK